MKIPLHPTSKPQSCGALTFRLSTFIFRLSTPSRPFTSSPLRTHVVVLGALCALCGSIKSACADDDLTDLLHAATPAATAPAPLTTQPAAPIDPFHTAAAHLPAEARPGAAVLSNSVTLTGQLWTTAASPLRLWQDNDKIYKDIDWATIKKIEVIVNSATMEKDWRWLKEGSDEKVYSGKSYPLIELRYIVTLSNDQTLTGGIVAPIYLNDGKKTYNLALYKKFKGTLDQTLDDVVYIRSFTLTADGPAVPHGTTKLPLISD